MKTHKETGKLQNFFSHGKKIVYKKGEVILRPDDIPQGIYFIQEGYAKEYFITEFGNEHLFALYKAKEIFPIKWTFGNIRQDTFLQAVINTTVYRVSKQELLAYLKQDRQAVLEINKCMLSFFDLYISRINTLEYTHASFRLVSYLIFLVDRFGKLDSNSCTLNIPITHQDIANSTNITRETVSREFHNLEKKGLATYKNRMIIIHNFDMLKKELAPPIKTEYS
jgi:CRP/FNR family transcriptional regulator, cyclic AMP receptor protein